MDAPIVLYFYPPSSNNDDEKELSQEDEDLISLESLHPMKNIREIKEISQRRYSFRRSILQKTCRRIHSKCMQGITKKK